MSPRLTIAIAAAAALASAPALAASATTHDDTTYPETAAIWAGLQVSPDQSATYDDVAYPGAHMTIAKEAPLPAPGAVLAIFDDTVYPTADRAPARVGPANRAMPECLACGCARR